MYKTQSRMHQDNITKLLYYLFKSLNNIENKVKFDGIYSIFGNTFFFLN